MTPRWLDDDERKAWLGLIASTSLLDAALDRQLRRDAGISHATYALLVVLTEAPERSLHMQKLSVLTNSSPSRLSHAIARMEQDGYVVRSPCPRNKKAVHAAITPAGLEVVRAAAPGHVDTVRNLVFDGLSKAQVRQLVTISSTILDALERSGHQRPDFIHED